MPSMPRQEPIKILSGKQFPSKSKTINDEISHIRCRHHAQENAENVIDQSEPAPGIPFDMMPMSDKLAVLEKRIAIKFISPFYKDN